MRTVARSAKRTREGLVARASGPTRAIASAASHTPRDSLLVRRACPGLVDEPTSALTKVPAHGTFDLFTPRTRLARRSAGQTPAVPRVEPQQRVSFVAGVGHAQQLPRIASSNGLRPPRALAATLTLP
jgi:hypothetical protein